MSEAPALPRQASNYDGVVEALRARKEELGYSDLELDARAGLAAGHTSKVLGPARTKGMGSVVLELYMAALAVDVVIVDSPAKRALLVKYDGRLATAVRRNHRLSMVQFERMKPMLLRQMSALGNEARNRQLPAMLRSAIARRAGKASAKARRAKRKLDQAGAAR